MSRCPSCHADLSHPLGIAAHNERVSETGERVYPDAARVAWASIQSPESPKSQRHTATLGSVVSQWGGA